MGVLKEYHVGDALLSPLGKEFIVKNTKGEDGSQALNRLLQSVGGVYEKYFLKLLDEKVRWTGDITPSYAMRKAKDFLFIKKRLELNGFSVKVIFLMRDPVERNWSGLRMHQRQMQRKGTPINDESLPQMFEDYYKSPPMEARTHYDQTVTARRSSFAETDLYLGFYETLFSEKSMADLSDLLGLDISQADFNEKIHASKVIPLSPELRASCRDFYADVYSYCGRQFPLTGQLWAPGV